MAVTVTVATREQTRTLRRGGDVHQLALDRFRLASDAYSNQAKRELDDLKFAARIGQWRPDELEARQALRAGGVTLGARPTLTVDKLRQPIQQLENQQRQANLAVDVHPAGARANLQTAQVLQGIYRHIQVESRADQIARFWAYSRALKCGRGCYRVEKVYAHRTPDPTDPARFDQDIRISRILNQAGVLLDPYAQEPDWCDMEWAFVKAWVPRDRYGVDHPDSELASDDADFSLIGAQAPGWVRFGDNGRCDAILEVEYWRCEYGDPETLTSGEDVEEPGYQTRDIRDRKVYCCKLNAKEIYDEIEWDGIYIPLIPVVANEENLDGERIWEGLVAPAKDSQRAYNALTSAFIETVALAPKSPWLATTEQIGPFKTWWDQSNLRNFPYLPYKAQSEGGNLLPPPTRVFGEPPIQAIAMGIREMDANLNATTGFFDPSRGNLSRGERSGVALKALQAQTETGNSGYLDNLAQISMTYEAKVVLDLIPKVYDRPGRLVPLLGLDNQRSSVVVNAPSVPGPNGQPIALPQGPQGPLLPPGAALEDVSQINLAEGVYTSAVTIGKTQATAATEASEAMGALLQAEPQLLQLIGDLYFKYQDWPGAQEISERLKKMLPPPLQDPAQQQQSTAMLQQQNAQLQQQLQQLGPLADQNQAKLQQAQLDAQAKLQAAQLDAQTKQQIAAAQEETKRLIAQLQLEMTRLKAMADTNIAAGKAQADLAQTVYSEAADTRRQAHQHLHDAALGAAEGASNLHREAILATTAPPPQPGE